MTISRRLARPLLATSFIVGGSLAISKPQIFSGDVRPLKKKVAAQVQEADVDVPVPDDATQDVRIWGAVHVVGGLMLATDRAPRLASTVLAASMVPTIAGTHRFWEKDGEERVRDAVHFAKDTSILGGLLIAALDKEGRPSMSYRAGKAVKDARREAKHLGVHAGQEVRAQKNKLS
ncbi:DoxX family protein [Nocardioidaceae bacterium]|nr:DoxX family protein [Nocardioidaceae bacterium]